MAINVEHLDQALAFYRDALGLTVRPDRPDFGVPGAWLEAGNQQVHLVQAAPPASRGQHFALAVGDLDAVVAELRSRGVTVSEASDVGPGRQSFVTDPSGNVVELHQPAS